MKEGSDFFLHENWSPNMDELIDDIFQLDMEKVELVSRCPNMKSLDLYLRW